MYCLRRFRIVALLVVCGPRRSSSSGTPHAQGGRRPGFESARRNLPPAGEAEAVPSRFSVDVCRVHLVDASFGSPPQTVKSSPLCRQRQTLGIVLIIIEPVCSLTSQLVQRDPSRVQFRGQIAPESRQQLSGNRLV